MIPTADRFLSVKKRVAFLASKAGRNFDEITLIAVSKNCSWECAAPVYDAGCRDFGENRVSEAVPKMVLAPNDIRWHMIGSLQKNKVRKIVGSFALIHSVDSVELAEKIAQCSEDIGVESRVLLQVNTSGEASKHGLTERAWREAFSHLATLRGISIEGLMTMAPFVEDEGVIRDCFIRLRLFRDELRKLARESGCGHSFQHLSMGMSHDYPIAIEEGATLLRIGSAIFK